LSYDLMFHRVVGLRAEAQVGSIGLITLAEFRTGINARFLGREHRAKNPPRSPPKET
jgi:hypothetical protein